MRSVFTAQEDSLRLRYLAVLLLVITPLAAQLTHVLSPELIYSNSRASVVTVLTFDASRAPLTQGSGFIVANNRVVTNYHVVAGCSSASLVFADGTISIVTAVISASEPKDLVVLEVRNRHIGLALGLGDELDLKVGGMIYAIGAPSGLSASLSSGLVSGFRQDEGQFLKYKSAPRSAPALVEDRCLTLKDNVVGVTTSRQT